MEEFQVELAKLLEKYPSLPKFQLTVQPRFVIQTEPEKVKVVMPQNIHIGSTGPAPFAGNRPIELEPGEVHLPPPPSLRELAAASTATML